MPEKPLDGEDERYGGVDEDDSGRTNMTRRTRRTRRGSSGT